MTKQREEIKFGISPSSSCSQDPATLDINLSFQKETISEMAIEMYIYIEFLGFPVRRHDQISLFDFGIGPNAIVTKNLYLKDTPPLATSTTI